MARTKIATEFGGVPGRTQPAPSPLSAADKARLQRASNPVDPAGSEDTALLRELEMEGRL